MMARKRDIDGLRKRQTRLRESFLDLANSFIALRMRFQRRTGIQPPDGDDRPPKRR